VVVPTQSFESDSPNAQTDDVLFALGSMASHMGELAGTLLVFVQLLARDRLISMADAKRLIRLLSAESPEVERQATAQCVLRRKPRSYSSLNPMSALRGYRPSGRRPR
jgi:hypothetical protein